MRLGGLESTGRQCDMSSARIDEVERTFDVDEGAVLPTIAAFGGVSTLGDPDELLVETEYFDTADLDLVRHGVTLRRRTGGHDAGWHLKVPKDKDTRSELHLQSGDGAVSVPDELVDPIRVLVRDRALLPIARVSTRRLERSLSTDESVVLAQVRDDRVRAERLHGPVLVQEWREWEVELVDGDRFLLDAVEKQLLAAGATPSAAGSKLARSLDDLVPARPDRPSRKRLAHGDIGQFVVTYLAAHVAELQRQDMRLRADHPESIHELRIAARRLRSALKTYGPVFEPRSLDRVGDELRWLGQSLSDARDAQVLRERLRDLVASESPELVLGPVMNRIDDELRTALCAGHEQALQALNTERYFRLLDSLDKLVRSAPLGPGGALPARKVLPTLLRRDAKRLRRAVKATGRAETSQDRDQALHGARKKAKRMRYAAESATPILGKPAKVLASSAKTIQQAIGDHQDAVVSRTQLREYAVRAHGRGENGFTFGRLHALEQTRAEAAEREFHEAWETLPGKNVRIWSRTRSGSSS